MPPIKAIEIAQFGGVDSRSNPITMPASRWLVCKNWIPKPDGHLELREGYMIRVYNQTGGGAAYSLTPYTVAVPDSYLNPPPPLVAYSPVTGFRPPISQVLPNGTRCALYWQQAVPSQAQTTILSVACSIQAAGVPILAIYKVQSTARFVLGSYVVVQGVVSNASTPANFFNGNFQVEAIGNGTITLFLGTSTRALPTPRILPLPPPVRPPLPSPTAAFTVSPGSINFGNVSAGTSASVTVTLTFTTSASTGIGALNSASLSNSNFTLTPSSPSASGLRNGQTTSFQVNINQTLTGPYSATLTIATTTETFNISVSATVVGSDLSIAPPQIVFPSTPQGVISSGHPGCVITNNSNATITFSNPTFSNPDFVFIPGNAFSSIAVPAGGTLAFQLNATPSIVGPDTGTLTISTTDPNFPQIAIALEVVGTSPGSGGVGGYPENYAGTGGTITAVLATPGPPDPLLIPLTSAAGSAFLPGTFPIKGMPILSTARWHYALGKDGYLYMHNGTDAKFFDGVCFRDIGLPTLTPGQLGNIRVSIGYSGPNAAQVGNPANVTWNATGGDFRASIPYSFYYVFFNTQTNAVAPCSTPIGGGPISPTQDSSNVTFTLPAPSAPTVGLIALNTGGAGASFLTQGVCAVSMSGSGTTVTCTVLSGQTVPNWSLGQVIAIDDLNTPWHSNGPFAVTVTGASTFTFQAPQGVDASIYTRPEVAIAQLLTVPSGSTTLTLSVYNPLLYQGSGVSTDGVLQLPYVEAMAANLLPASAIGGAQPGYQFYACIYNPITGHVGNRTPIGIRIDNPGDCTIVINGLPDFTVASSEIQSSQGKIPTILLPTSDPEWRILIGRTGDGGEVPYATIDSNGNWITTLTPNQTSINPLSPGQLDSNSELPFDNYPPPRSHLTPVTQESFANFWREGDRLCGTLQNSPFIYRSGSEVDATTGIFVGDPAQAWDPAKLETFPTAENVIGGFGYMQESWVYTRNDVAQLSELSGEVSWNGPYNFGIVGSFAFAKGWQSLPFWVSHDRQLCTILPDGNGPISISTEYEKTLLTRIGDEYDAAGNPLMYMGKTELVYFRDPERLVDVIRIKCVDNSGNPFTIIHDFNLRDDASPYGQGYEEDYLGPLAIDYQSAYIRDSMAYSRIWATASDGQIYQFYTGGLDNVDYYDGTVGEAFTADAISLRYLGGERTVARTLEFYGDNSLQWLIYENMLNVNPDPNYWVNVTYDMRPFPGDAQAAHYIADIQRPEMIHCYLRVMLTAHPQDATDPLSPMALNDPPHIPLEWYGRLFLSAPWLGGSRGR